MRRLSTILAVLFMTLAFTAAVSAGTPIDYDDGPPISNAQIKRQHDKAQKCRAFLGYKPWPSGESWKWAVGREYRGWLYGLWLGRANACVDVRKDWMARERDVVKAFIWAADTWNVDRQWILNCLDGEGGKNVNVIVHGAAGEIGWGQFLPGTFKWMSNGAWKARYPAPPPRFKSIYSPVGQAYTMAWAFSAGYQSPGWRPEAPQWYGKGC